MARRRGLVRKSRFSHTGVKDGLIKEVDEQNNLKKYEQHADAPCPGSTR
jgi:hypothetical protein